MIVKLTLSVALRSRRRRHTFNRHLVTRSNVVGAFAFFLATVAAPAQAQRSAWIGVGATPPAGDSKEAIKTGWLLDVGVAQPLGASKFALQAGGLFGSNSAKVGDGSSTLLGAMVNIIYGTGFQAKLGWYAYAGGGFLNLKPDAGEWKTHGAFQMGAGLSRQLNAKHDLWAEVRYLGAGQGIDFELTLMPITVGITRLFGPRQN